MGSKLGFDKIQVEGDSKAPTEIVSKIQAFWKVHILLVGILSY